MFSFLFFSLFHSNQDIRGMSEPPLRVTFSPLLVGTTVTVASIDPSPRLPWSMGEHAVLLFASVPEPEMWNGVKTAHWMHVHGRVERSAACGRESYRFMNPLS